MTSSLWLLWILTGGAIASWVMMHIWLPDPPPNIAGKFIGMLIAGIIGGVVGGILMRSVATEPDPHPWTSFVGVVAVALIVSMGTAVLGRIGARSTR